MDSLVEQKPDEFAISFQVNAAIAVKRCDGWRVDSPGRRVFNADFGKWKLLVTAVTSEIENDVLFNHIAEGTETRWARFLILRNRNIGCIGVTKQSISKSPIAG